MNITEQVTSVIQRVKQEDGTYKIVFPINTLNEVYYDLENDITLKEYLETEGSTKLITVANDDVRFALTSDSVSKMNVVHVASTSNLYFVINLEKLSEEAGYLPFPGNDSDSKYLHKETITVNGDSNMVTSHDVYTYVGSNGVVDSDVMIKLPIEGTSNGISVSADIDLSGDDHIMLNNLNNFSIDEFAGNDGDGGNGVICSDIAGLGTHMIVSGKGTTNVVKAYAINDSKATSMDIGSVFTTDVTKCSMADDGSHFAALDGSGLRLFYKLTDSLYYETSTITSITTSSSVSFIKVLDPFRTLSSSTTRNYNSEPLYLVVGFTNTAPKVYQFGGFNSATDITSQNLFVFNSAIVTSVAATPDSRYVMFGTSNGSPAVLMYSFSIFSAKYSTLTSSIQTGVASQVYIAPDYSKVGIVRTSAPAVLSVYTVSSFNITSTVTNITNGGAISTVKFTADNHVLIAGYKGAAANDRWIKYVNLANVGTLLNTDTMENLITQPLSNIGFSSNSKYGFVIKGTTIDTSPQILPFERTDSRLVSVTGSNPTEMAISEHAVISQNGKYMALIPIEAASTSIETPLSVYKKIDGVFTKLPHASTITSIQSSTVKSIVINNDGTLVCVVTQTRIYIYRNIGNDVYTELIVPSTTGPYTCATLTEPFNGYNYLILGMEAYPYIEMYSMPSPTATDLSFVAQKYTGTITSPEIANSVVGLGSYSNRYVYMAVEASASTCDVYQYAFGGGTILNTPDLLGTFSFATGDTITLQTSFDGEYISVIPSSDTWKIFTRNNSLDVSELTINGVTATDVSDIQFDINKTYMYTVDSSYKKIQCYSLKQTDDAMVKNATLISTYTDNALSNIKKIYITDSEYGRLVAYAGVYPYVFVFDIKKISGFCNLTFSGTLLTDSGTTENGIGYSRNIWKNTALSYNNPELIRDVHAATLKSNGYGVIVIRTVDGKLINHNVQISKFIIFDSPNTDIDYNRFLISNTLLTGGTIENIVNIPNKSTSFDDVNFTGSATLNNKNISTLTRERNVVMGTGKWIAELVPGSTVTHYKYRIYDHRITTESIVNVDIKDIASLNIATAANIKGITIEGDGHVDLFATNKPTGDIIVDVNIFN